MTRSVPDDQDIQNSLMRFAAGDDSVLSQLLEYSHARLEQLTRRMLRDFERVRRWEETADVLQAASIRLYRALQNNRPTTVPGFLALATLQIRRELMDLARHYYGPEGYGTHHETRELLPTGATSSSAFDAAALSDSFDPQRLSYWSEFHRQADLLPSDEKEVFDLLFYQGFSQESAAGLLQISERTVQRRWQQARQLLSNALGGTFPES